MRTFIASLVVLVASSGAFACPMCKDSVANREGSFNELHDSYNSNGQNISSGLNVSVYVMLGTLLGVMGMVSMVVVKGVRGSDRPGRGFPMESGDELRQ
ncbi:MAG TPA: hypothetical protein VH475_24605 [Tepidisphaeraceae bacterium]|jgi:hypothetical protein